MALSIKRAEWVSLGGLVIHFLSGVVTLVIGRWSESLATTAVGWHVLGGAVVWLLLWLQFHQRRLADEERLELEALRRERAAQLGTDATIFDEEAGDELDVISARRRLRWLERIFSPVMALLLAAYLVAFGAMLGFTTALGDRLHEASEQVNSLEAAGFLAGMLLLQFLLSRYATGMSRYGPWSYLRAGGSYSLGTTFTTGLAALGQLVLNAGQLWAESILLWIVPVLMIFQGIEIIINFVMDFYRPKIKGQLPRPCYDSRLMGLFSEPEGVLASMAHAIDYQFGFKVSQTWFYKLLERTVLWLVIFQVLTLYLSTCFAIVQPDEQAIKTHFGSVIAESGRPKVYEAGLYVKWPWPIDRFQTYPAHKIQHFQIAAHKLPERREDRAKAHGELMLWTSQHLIRHEQLLVPLPVRSESGGLERGEETSVPVAIFNGWVSVQWRVRRGGLPDFLLNNREPERLLKSLAWQVVTQYLAKANFVELLARNRLKMTTELTRRLQEAADEHQLGVEILLVGVWDLHPPAAQNVAANYFGVIAAQFRRDAQIYQAEGHADAVLAKLCGSAASAEKLDKKLKEMEGRVGRPGVDEREGGEVGLMELMDETGATGQAKAILLKAEGDAVKQVMRAEGDNVTFASQVYAYDQAPSVFTTRARLRMIDDVLDRKGVRKYLNLTDVPTILRLNLEEKLVDVLDTDILGTTKEGKK